MTFDIGHFTPEERQVCMDEASRRFIAHHGDAERGDYRALNSYGGHGSLDARTIRKRKEEALMGVIAELIASKFAKCVWTKEIGQYKGNTNPDLKPTFRGKLVNCEVRGTRQTDSIIYRPHQDDRRPDCLLIVVTNLPMGSICHVGHAFFRDITKLAKAHPEWIGQRPGSPFYWIPFEHLSEDFSEFGE